MENCEYKKRPDSIADILEKIKAEQYAEWSERDIGQFVSDHSGGRKCDHNATEMRPSFISDHSGGANKMVDHIPDATKMMPLTLEQLRQMDGKPVSLEFDFELEPMTALVECVESADCIILTNNLGGRSEFYSDEELRESGIKAYAYQPAHIDLEAWEPCKCCKACSSCKHFLSKDSYEFCAKCTNGQNHKPLTRYCPSCGRPLTAEAWSMLVKRLLGITV